MGSVTVRQATTDDVEAITAIQNALIATTTVEWTSTPRNAYPRWASSSAAGSTSCCSSGACTTGRRHRRSVGCRPQPPDWMSTMSTSKASGELGGMTPWSASP